MTIEQFWAQFLTFILPYLKAFLLAIAAAFADEHVVESIKVFVQGTAKKRLGDWALIVAFLVPAAVVYFLGLDFFRSVFSSADPLVTKGITTFLIATLSGWLHKNYREKLVEGRKTTKPAPSK